MRAVRCAVGVKPVRQCTEGRRPRGHLRFENPTRQRARVRQYGEIRQRIASVVNDNGLTGIKKSWTCFPALTRVERLPVSLLPARNPLRPPAYRFHLSCQNGQSCRTWKPRQLAEREVRQALPQGVLFDGRAQEVGRSKCRLESRRIGDET